MVAVRLASLLALRCAVAVDVWIDTDNSAGVGGGVRDVDDAWALLHLLNAKDVHVVAVSTVFGNADVDAVTKATRALLKASGHTGVPCFRGAARAGDRNTTASRRLRAHQGSKRVIRRRFNVSVPRARVSETAPTLRERSER